VRSHAEEGHEVPREAEHSMAKPQAGKSQSLQEAFCYEDIGDEEIFTQESSLCKAWEKTEKNRQHRQRWGLSVHKILSFSGRCLVQWLQQEKILPNMSNTTCPKCGTGTLGKAQYRKDRDQWIYRCSLHTCSGRIRVEDCHPIFDAGAGNSKTPLNIQAGVLYCAVAGVPRNSAHLLLDVDPKMVERIYSNNETARARYVEMKEKEIIYGDPTSQIWTDVEADEVDLGEEDLQIEGNHPVISEQWAGLVERGRPESLQLFKLKPAMTKRRAPGPGAIRKQEWQPIGKKHLTNKKIILHTDGAKAYQLQIPEVIHCHVVQKKGQSQR